MPNIARIISVFVLRRLLVISVLIVLNQSACAQLQGFGDTLRRALKTKPGFMIGFDSKKSFYGNQRVDLNGFRMGLDFNKKIRFYIGYYELMGPARDVLVKSKLTPNPTVLNTSATFNYWQLASDFIFYDAPRWQFTIPVGIGYGTGVREQWNSDSSYFHREKNFFVPCEISVSGMYRIFYWLGVGGSIGYRFSFPSYITSSAFDGPVYSAGLRFFPLKIIKGLIKGQDAVRIKKKYHIPG